MNGMTQNQKVAGAGPAPGSVTFEPAMMVANTRRAPRRACAGYPSTL